MRNLLFALFAVFILTTSYVDKKEKSGADTTKTLISPTSEKDSVSIKSEVAEISISQNIYDKIDFSSGTTLKFDVFEKAFLGFNNLKKARKIDEKAKTLQEKLQTEKQIHGKLQDVASDIVEGEKEIEKIKDKIEELSRTINDSQEVVQRKSEYLDKLTKDTQILSSQKKDLEQKIIKIILPFCIS